MGSQRTSLLIRCSALEAKTIRDQAHADRRAVSHYVLNLVMRAVGLEERIFASRPTSMQQLNRSLSRKPLRQPGPRTALQIHCSTDEARRIRATAKLRQLAISGFVLHSLRRAWAASGIYLETANPET